MSLVSVQFNPIWYLCAGDCPHALNPVSFVSVRNVAFETIPSLTDDDPLLCFQGRLSGAFLTMLLLHALRVDSEHVSFLPLSPPGDLWCGVFGFERDRR